MKTKIVVAYSGGLDTSVMVKWLKDKYDAEIITVTSDLGQGKELEGLEEKAKLTGASKSYIFDLKDEFINEYAWLALKTGALYEGNYPLATAIGRPLLVKKLVEVAKIENANIIAHGCTGKGNDQVRFEVALRTLAPETEIMAPVRDWEFRSREDEIDYAIKNNIPINVTKESPYSIDENLWGIAIECGVLENLSNSVPEDAFQWTTNPTEAPDKPETFVITFEKGIPVKLNNKFISGVELVKTLNTAGSAHGIGRFDLVENRIVGIKSREIYEAPAALILHTAHFELEKMVIDKDTFRYKQDVSNRIANLIYDGQWFSYLFESLIQFVEKTQEFVTGEITLEIYKGNVTIKSRYSPYSLYDEELATYTDADTFNHKDAAGFIKLYGLQNQIMAKKRKEKAENVVGW